MVAYRRASWNFALDRALALAVELDKPLVVLEPLRCDYPWASDRLHAFVLQGMADNRRAFASQPVTYYPYVEPAKGAGKGLLAALAEDACAVVTDDWPCFFVPAMQQAAADSLSVRVEAIDGNGLLPMATADRMFKRAVDLRRFLQKELAPHLLAPPAADPFDGVELPRLDPLPELLQRCWPVADPALLSSDPGLLAADPALLAALPIDHSVPAVDLVGGSVAARARLETFLDHGLPRYSEGRLDADHPSTSGLSPYLHFGHLSTHEILDALGQRQGWSPDRVEGRTLRGARNGWWNLDPESESFLDELVTWRELGFNRGWHATTGDAKALDDPNALPAWARQTLEDHADDPRDFIYTLAEFEEARTHDPLWNAAQRELVTTGRMHNYLRMLWGKKILHWSATPWDALDVMIELNNKYALDGRDPNSYSGIFWCLGLYDRAWGPERPIFGKVRYMTSDSTRRKMRLDGYLRRFGSPSPA